MRTWIEWTRSPRLLASCDVAVASAAAPPAGGEWRRTTAMLASGVAAVPDPGEHVPLAVLDG